MKDLHGGWSYSIQPDDSVLLERRNLRTKSVEVRLVLSRAQLEEILNPAPEPEPEPEEPSSGPWLG